MESAEVPKPQEEPIISAEWVDLLVDDTLGKHADIFGPNTATFLIQETGRRAMELDSKDPLYKFKLDALLNPSNLLSQSQLSPLFAEDFFEITQKFFTPRKNPDLRSAIFATVALAHDSERRLTPFVNKFEDTRTALKKLSEKLVESQSSDSEGLQDPNLIANISLAVEGSILLGYTAPVKMFDDMFRSRYSFADSNFVVSDEWRQGREKLAREVKETVGLFSQYQENLKLEEFYDIEAPPEMLQRLLAKDFTGVGALERYSLAHALAVMHQGGGKWKDPLGLNYAVAKGFLTAKARFQSAGKLYLTMSNTS